MRSPAHDEHPATDGPPPGPIAWFDPGSFRGRGPLDEASTDARTTWRRFRIFAWTSFALSLGVLLTPLAGFWGRPSLVALVPAAGCVVASAYLVAIAAPDRHSGHRGTGLVRRGRVSTVVEHLWDPGDDQGASRPSGPG